MTGVCRLFAIFLTLLLLLGFTQRCIASGQSVEEQLAAIQQLENPAQAVQAYEALLSDQSLSPSAQISVLTSHAMFYFQQSEFEQAITTISPAVLLANEHPDKTILAKTLKFKGIFHYYQGSYPQALPLYQQSLVIYQALNKPLEQGHLYNNLGLLYSAMGKSFRAIEVYQQAVETYKKYGSEVDIVDIRYNIATLYIRLRRYDLAIELFQEVIIKRLEFGDEKGVANARSDLGISYKQSGNYADALKNLQLALRYFQEQQDTFKLASTYHNLAEVYNELNQAEQAKVYAQLAINLSERQSFNVVLAGGLQSLARALFLQGEIEQPLQLLQRSTEVATQSDYPQQLRANLSLLSLVHAANGERRKAMENYQDFIALNFKLSNDQLNEYLAKFESDELKKQVAQLQQNKKVKQLELERANQQQKIVFGVIFIALMLILMLAFYLYRREKDRQLKTELAIQVKQRTQELERITEQLKQANNVKSQFLANMSHEIRTPLTAIIGQAEAIIYGDIQKGQTEQEVEVIHSNSQHLLELINNILDLSKIEANKLELDLQNQDLNQVLVELANMFAEQAKHKGLVFTITHSLPTPFLIDMDVLRVKQILINLCSNAIKFTSKGSVTVNVRIENHAIVFSVKDTGIGLSYTQIQQVFDSFTQGDSSISRRFGGTGLGLCLSEQLAKLMHGRIEIESQLGQGSTFTFVLPFTQTEELPQIEQVHTIDTETVSLDEPCFSGTVLLAEDHDDNRRLFARFLKKLGLTVVGASNGYEAVEEYESTQPDLILLDIQMPEMDGIEAFNILQQKGCTVPIIALTANAMSHEVAHYIALGFTEHLQKPIERSKFISTLAKYFDSNVGEETAEQALDNIDMTDLVQQFKSTLTLEQQDIVLHLKANDHQLLKNLVHRIAGAAQMFGFSMLSEKALVLEKVIKTENFAEINDATQGLLNEIDQVLW
ncbi:tetratricopeptide repeat protein [Thalassotalea sp. G2M2-11]|uniref:tetratricopeptide repeat protein n=1 Tax=Thalassotalea sp. G2M2-11 TaxID=2787627 RepID=UPI0019D13881|nr:tetratricopeptide repeat protein [Thalassotalea sp. G2M2-11]